MGENIIMLQPWFYIYINHNPLHQAWLCHETHIKKEILKATHIYMMMINFIS